MILDAEGFQLGRSLIYSLSCLLKRLGIPGGVMARCYAFGVADLALIVPLPLRCFVAFLHSIGGLIALPAHSWDEGIGRRMVAVDPP